MRLRNYAQGQWVEGAGEGTPLFHAVTGEPIATAGSDGLDFAGFRGKGDRSRGTEFGQPFNGRARVWARPVGRRPLVKRYAIDCRLSHNRQPTVRAGKDDPGKRLRVANPELFKQFQRLSFLFQPAVVGLGTRHLDDDLRQGPIATASRWSTSAWPTAG